MPHPVAAALAGAALAILPAVPAQAGEQSRRPLGDFRGSPVNTTAPGVPARLLEDGLRLSLTYPGRRASATRSVVLWCDPPGGSHPLAAEACQELGRQRGRLTHEPDGTACTMMYSPVVAAAEGHWRRRPVRFHKEYPSDCIMRAHTGSLFAF